MQVRISLIASAVALALAAIPAAWAGVHVSIGINPFGVVTVPPPPVVYAPAPVYAAPIYAAPPVVYVGGGNWGGPGRPRDWHRDRDHHHH